MDKICKTNQQSAWHDGWAKPLASETMQVLLDAHKNHPMDYASEADLVQWSLALGTIRKFVNDVVATLRKIRKERGI